MMGGVEANALATFSTGGWCDGVVFYYGKNGRERKERNLSADRRQDNAADYTPFSPLASMGVQLTLVSVGENG